MWKMIAPWRRCSGVKRSSGKLLFDVSSLLLASLLLLLLLWFAAAIAEISATVPLIPAACSSVRERKAADSDDELWTSSKLSISNMGDDCSADG